MDNGTRGNWLNLIRLSHSSTEEWAGGEIFNLGRSVEQALKLGPGIRRVVFPASAKTKGFPVTPGN